MKSSAFLLSQQSSINYANLPAHQGTLVSQAQAMRYLSVNQTLKNTHYLLA